MKKKRRGWIWIVVLVLAGAGAAFLLPVLLPTGNTALDVQQYKAEKVTTGEIRVLVHGTGSIEAMDTSTVSASTTGTVDQLLVENGDTVKAGQLIATLDAEPLNNTIDSLKEQIVVQDATIASLRTMPGTKYLTAPVDCRVKAVYAKEGEDTNVSMSKHGALLVLSTDGKMKVSFVPKDGAKVVAGAPVKFVVGSVTLSGFITEVPDSTTANAQAMINNDSITEGRLAIIKDSKGAELGRGSLKINRPLLVTATSGKVEELYVEAGDTMKAGKKLAKLSGYILNPDFEAQLVKRQQLQDDLDEAYADLQELSIAATADGIVTDLMIEENGTVQDGMSVCKIQENAAFKLVVAVDELDIPRIALGQRADVKIDALPDQAATGEVIRIAPIGVKANDVTTYDVTLRLTSPAGTLAAMSASADIEVAFKSGALLVPVEAIRTVNGKSWVYLAMDHDVREGAEEAISTTGRTGFRLPGFLGRQTDAADQEALRQKVDVKVGLVSDTWAEIVEGLQEGDEVAVPVSQSSSSGMMGFGGMGGQGGNRSGD